VIKVVVRGSGIVPQEVGPEPALEHDTFEDGRKVEDDSTFIHENGRMNFHPNIRRQSEKLRS
jgi:hypothetical protein